MARLRHLFFLMILLFSVMLSAEPIKIGVVGPFSGPNIATGDHQWDGVFQAVQDINEQGGIEGDKIVLVSADTSCDPQKTVTAANKLIEANVLAVVGHICSGSSIVASKIYAPLDIVMITPASTSPILTESGYKNVFRTCGRDDVQGEVAGNFIINTLKAKKIILIHDSSVYGKGLTEATRKTLEKLGGEIVFEEAIVREQRNFSSLIDKINKTSADLIYFGGLETDAGRLLKHIRESNNQITFFSGDGIATPDFVKVAGGPHIVEDTYFTYRDPLQLPQARKILKEFQEAYIIPTGYTLNSYAAVQAIAEAIKQTRSRDKKVIARWLHENKVDSVIGELEWDKKGDLKNAQYNVYQWNDEGSYKRVN